MRSGFKAWDLWGVPLFVGTKREIFPSETDSASLRNFQPFWIATVNPEHVMKAVEDKSYMELLNKTDINVMDGIGLLWAKALQEKFQITKNNFSARGGLRFASQTSSKKQFPNLQTILKKLWIGFWVGIEILGGKHREGLIAGSELMKEMIEEAGRTGKKVFLLGGWGDRAAVAARNFKFLIFNFKNNLKIETCAGEPVESNSMVIEKINKFQPDYLFVAYGMKKQEEWILKNKDKLKVGMVMGVGRSFDYYSGDLKIAPKWVRRMGLEWLYSLIQEPKRWRRQLALVRFVGRVILS
ncbi:MAG: WecB/TagA/CpsF family glycosyltransferase [Candidatus Shapirobacteria bacterium]